LSTTKNELTGYELSRRFFDWSFENPDKIKPVHVALYFFIIEHCNRMGWKQKFGLPSGMAKDAIGVSSYNTYIKTFNDLVDWGFIKLVTKSTNQYSSNVIALSKFDKAHNKALDKALIKHVTKQSESTDSIIKPLTNNHKPVTVTGSDEPAPYWKNFLKKYLEWYGQKFNEHYELQGKDFKALKKIHSFLEKRAVEKKAEFTEAWLLDAFGFFLEKAWSKDQWLRDNFSIPNILSQFNQIANANQHRQAKQNSSHQPVITGRATTAGQF